MLRTHDVAIVIGNTICLHNCSKQKFLQDERWLLHELRHVEQWQENSYWIFPIKYIWYSLRYGYKKNPFELDATAHENERRLLNKFNIL